MINTFVSKITFPTQYTNKITYNVKARLIGLIEICHNHRVFYSQQFN